MGFRFSLDALLQVKENRVKTLKRELAVLKRALADERDRLEGYREERKRYMEELQRKQREGILPAEVLWYEGFISDLADKIHWHRKRVEELERSIEEKRQELVVASQQKRILERLKEKRWAEFMRELDRRERAFLDEIGIRRNSFL